MTPPKMNKEEKAIRKLIEILKYIPQSSNFSDVNAHVIGKFKNALKEIEDILNPKEND